MSRADALAGRRDRLVRVEQLTEGGEPGFPVEEWVPLATVYAHREDVSVRERFSFTAGQETVAYDTRWSLPWIPAMNPELVDVPKCFRLVVERRVHDIVGVVEIQREVAIELTTLSGAIETDTERAS